MNLADMKWTGQAVEERGFCARRFGTDYAIFGSTEEACRQEMVRCLGKSWRWLRWTGWSVAPFSTWRMVWTAHG